MKIYYDFHIHSCLSPCADMEMTPNNIVNMSLLNGLNMIAITDHNSCKNCRAVVEAGKRAGLLVVPGMEICTNEEVHVVCLFENIECAEEFSKYVYSNMMLIEHRPDIFGEQVVLDLYDNEINKEPYYLLGATNISVNEILNITNEYNGTSFPAHIDRDSYSVISSLGDIPCESGFRTVEIADARKKDKLKSLYSSLKDMNVLMNSDSHYLESLVSTKQFIELDSLNIKSVIDFINGK